MSNITVAILAPNGYADALGKKGTTSDITFYNLKKGEATVTFIEPTRYPENSPHCSIPYHSQIALYSWSRRSMQHSGKPS